MHELSSSNSCVKGQAFLDDKQFIKNFKFIEK